MTLLFALLALAMIGMGAMGAFINRISQIRIEVIDEVFPYVLITAGIIILLYLAV